MNTRNWIKGMASLVVLAIPAMGIGCVGQVDSDGDESVGSAEEAINPTTDDCPQGPGTVLVSTGAASASTTDGLFRGACADTAAGRLAQYFVNFSASVDLALQCLDHCTDGGRFEDCDRDWRLDSAVDDPNVALYFPDAEDTANLGIGTLRLLFGQELSFNQEVTCLDRPDVNVDGDDAHQWVAICSCSNL